MSRGAREGEEPLIWPPEAVSGGSLTERRGGHKEVGIQGSIRGGPRKSSFLQPNQYTASRTSRPAKVYPATSFGGNTNRTVSTAIQARAPAFTTGEARPRSQGPRRVQRPLFRARCPSAMGTP